MHRRRFIILLALSVLGLSVDLSPAAEAPQPAKRPLEAGDVAPPIVALIASGSAIQEKPWDGKYVLLHFWSLGNASTARTMEQLRQLRKQFANDDRFRMISVCMDEDWDAWIRFQNRQGEVDYGDPRGKFRFFEDHKWWQVSQVTDVVVTSESYGVKEKSEFFLIDPEGRLRAVRIPAEKLRESITAALKRDP
ncbi:MAG: TlpA family protein disulfide reductase [Planctomycetota bacterium]